MKREMVIVTLYEDYTYEVVDTDQDYATQEFTALEGNKYCIGYFCPKTRWKEYLLKLIDPKKIDKEIEELQRKKRRAEKLREKILKKIEADKKRKE